MTVRFDDSLPTLCTVIRAQLGAEALRSGTVLRDATGRLAFFLSTSVSDEQRADLAAAIRAALGPYARTDRAIVGADDFGALAIRSDPSFLLLSVGSDQVRLVDRRLVGADWLRAPAAPAPPPPRFVFGSLKGGVGRSTALAVVAAALASHGKRVLTVDLDLEAPGLGALLLTPETVPEFGVLDALVENGLSQLDDLFYQDMLGPCVLAEAGRIEVIPVLGRRSLDNPGDVLAKLARAYVEDIGPDGAAATVMDQVSAIIAHFADPTRYDAILIDARAGLHETTAAAVLGLGAQVLLFGLDEAQTFQGYRLLLAHLARRFAGSADWLQRFMLVQGKAPADAAMREGFSQRCLEMLMASGLIDNRGADAALTSQKSPTQEQPVKPQVVPFEDVAWDDELPDEAVLPPEWSARAPLAILHDERFQGFAPLHRRDLLAERVIDSTFGELVAWVSARVKDAQPAGSA